jgi:polyhydroxyalkanoate synthesis regulator phasin
LTVEALRVRVEELGRRVTDLERTQPAVIERDVRELGREVAELHEEMRAVKRALYTLAFSITAGSLTVAFAAFQIWGAT